MNHRPQDKHSISLAQKHTPESKCSPLSRNTHIKSREYSTYPDALKHLAPKSEVEPYTGMFQDGLQMKSQENILIMYLVRLDPMGRKSLGGTILLEWPSWNLWMGWLSRLSWRISREDWSRRLYWRRRARRNVLEKLRWTEFCKNRRRKWSRV